MAESAAQREGDNESRLHRERLASSRASDAAADENRQRMSGARASDEAARQNLQRFSGVSGDDRVGPTMGWQAPPPVASRPTDASLGGAARDRAMEDRLNGTRRQEERQSEQRPSGGGGPSIRDATMLAKSTPAGLAASTAAGLATGQLSTEEMQRGVGRGCIMGLWNSLWLTFGHTIYPLAILFYMAWASKYVRKYIPEVGTEWIPGPMLAKIPKPLLIPIKMAEILGLAFILFWVFMLDMACLGLLALILGAILSAANFF
jgi:hypothetical protein